MSFAIKSGATKPIFACVLYAGGVPQDLTGATVKMTLTNVASGVKAVAEGTVQVVSAPNGQVQYVWQTGDTAVVGAYQAEFHVTFSDGSVGKWPSDGYVPVAIETAL